MDMNYYIAIDIGASSGRHIVGWLENGKLKTEEVYRFANCTESKGGHLIWNADKLFEEITRVNTIKDEDMLKLVELFGVKCRKDFLDIK